MKSRALIIVAILLLVTSLVLTSTASSHVRFPETRVGALDYNFTPDFEKSPSQNQDYIGLEQFLSDTFTSSTLVIQKEMDSTHLAYFGARYYDPTAGRFTNPDPFMGHLTDPRSQFFYAYGLNNPNRYIDLFGNSADEYNWYDPRGWMEKAKEIGDELSDFFSFNSPGALTSQRAEFQQFLAKAGSVSKGIVAIGEEITLNLPFIGNINCVVRAYIEGGESAVGPEIRQQLVYGVAIGTGTYVLVKVANKLAKLEVSRSVYNKIKSGLEKKLGKKNLAKFDDGIDNYNDAFEDYANKYDERIAHELRQIEEQANHLFPDVPRNEVITDPSRLLKSQPRPHYSISEIEISDELGFLKQQSYKSGRQTYWGEEGSVRPDLTHPNHFLHVEIKNYDLSIKSNRASLYNTIGKQARSRLQNLPPGSHQGVIIDIRGQNIDPAILLRVPNNIEIASGGIIKAENVVFWR